MNRELSGNEIKRILRKAGIETKHISVRHKWCGYSESYWVKIMSLDVDKKKVERICRGLESYEVDERTQEILQGGNTYIFVDYDWQLEYKAAV